MLDVRKFEFLSNNGEYSVVETPIETPSKLVPAGNGRFLRTWIGTSGTYSVKKLQVSTSKFVQLLLEKGGRLKIKNGEHLV